MHLEVFADHWITIQVVACTDVRARSDVDSVHSECRLQMLGLFDRDRCVDGSVKDERWCVPTVDVLDDVDLATRDDAADTVPELNATLSRARLVGSEFRLLLGLAPAGSVDERAGDDQPASQVRPEEERDRRADRTVRFGLTRDVATEEVDVPPGRE